MKTNTPTRGLLFIWKRTSESFTHVVRYTSRACMCSCGKLQDIWQIWHQQGAALEITPDQQVAACVWWISKTLSVTRVQRTFTMIYGEICPSHKNILCDGWNSSKQLAAYRGTSPCSSPINLSMLDIIISSLVISWCDNYVILCIAHRWFKSIWLVLGKDSSVEVSLLQKSGTDSLCVNPGGHHVRVKVN